MAYIIILLSLCCSSFVYAQALNSDNRVDKGLVILLHGLARSSSTMVKMQEALEADGFRTCNISYPSTKHPVSRLALDHVLPRIKECVSGHAIPIHFVTHSMGGIIVRYLAGNKSISSIGRVVMLSPPNKGSQVVDVLGNVWGFELINGPAGMELGTDNKSLPLQLGPADFEVGIITGNRSINMILSMMIDGDDDGKVSIENAALAGMKDFIVLPVAHPFIMKNQTAIKQTIYFLNHGAFAK